PPSATSGTKHTLYATLFRSAAINPTLGTGSWSVTTGTGNVTSQNSFSTQVTGLSVGNNSLLWTVTNGVCPTATSVVSIQRDATPSSNARPMKTICATTATLA